MNRMVYQINFLSRFEISFLSPLTDSQTKAEDPSLPCYLLFAGGDM